VQWLEPLTGARPATSGPAEEIEAAVAIQVGDGLYASATGAASGVHTPRLPSATRRGG
jgi:hypothetical protein